jgi:hypothetical protein
MCVRGDKTTRSTHNMRWLLSSWYYSSRDSGEFGGQVPRFVLVQRCGNQFSKKADRDDYYERNDGVQSEKTILIVPLIARPTKDMQISRANSLSLSNCPRSWKEVLLRRSCYLWRKSWARCSTISQRVERAASRSSVFPCRVAKKVENPIPAPEAASGECKACSAEVAMPINHKNT